MNNEREKRDLSLDFLNESIYFCFSNFNDAELTQCRSAMTFPFASRNPSPRKTCPKCPSQFAQRISIRYPSLSVSRRTDEPTEELNAGQPQPESNFDEELTNQHRDGEMNEKKFYS